MLICWALEDFKRTLAKLLPGVKTYVVVRRKLAKFRAQHFRPLGSLFAPAPKIFTDRPADETANINVNSEKYYEHTETA